MDERVKRMLKKGCPTEDIRLWAGMAHRVVELTGPMDTPEDLRIELFLHDDSAFRLLDMCDVIDERFEAIRTENERLRDLVEVLVNCGRKYHTMNGACPMFDAEADDFCGAVQAARELGIEVDA